MSRIYGGNGNYNSPIRYRCQRNFVITITDGLPTWDAPQIPNYADPDLSGPQGQGLPNWDQKSPNTNNPPYPQYSDGAGGSIDVEGSTLYLDDLAKFGYDIDLKPDGSETDDTGGSYEDSPYDPQRLETYTVGFTVDNQMLQDAAEYGHGKYFTANNLDDLTAALQGALSSIADKTSTAASLAATSTQASGDTRIFRATFNSGAWLGELSAFAYGGDPALDEPIWDASQQLPVTNQRKIFTLDGSRTGVAFNWNSIGNAGRQAIGSEAVLNYIRGSNAQTQSQGGSFRNRARVLGDIIHSTPAFVGEQSFGYSILTQPEGITYAAYVRDKSDRPNLVLVGANDGMLHAFDASDGAERFAYVPRQVFDDLDALTDPNYGKSGDTDYPNHRYYVDGSPAIGDAYFGDTWHSLAVTTLGRGGKGAFALDVTDPANFDPATDILWEIDPANVAMAPGLDNLRPERYLGENMGQPAVVRLENGDWVALLANGYNSRNERAALLVIDLVTGKVLDVLDTGAGGDNGLATLAAIDSDRDGSVDTVYAGDLRGNLWKFDLSGVSRDDWNVAYEDQPLFTARDNGNNRQPITSRPDVIAHPQGGVIVVFGTGRYLENGDTETTDEQSVYGVWDTEGAKAADGSPITDEPVSGVNALTEQTVVVQTSVGGRSVRVLSDNAVDYSTSRGWVFDLSRSGERITQDVQIFDGKAVLVSTIPAPDPCSFGGDSSLIEVNPLTGSQFDQPILDLNDDGKFDSSDGTQVSQDGEGGEGGKTVVYPGIVDLDVGLATNPYIFNVRSDSNGKGDQEKLVTGSNLNTQTLGEKGFLRPGRASWLQLR